MAGLQQQLVAHIKHKIIADNGARIRDGAVRLARDASKQNECLNVSKWVYVFGDASPRFASPTHDCWTTSFNQLDFPMAKFKSGIAVFYHTRTHPLPSYGYNSSLLLFLMLPQCRCTASNAHFAVRYAHADQDERPPLTGLTEAGPNFKGFRIPHK